MSYCLPGAHGYEGFNVINSYIRFATVFLSSLAHANGNHVDQQPSSSNNRRSGNSTELLELSSDHRYKGEEEDDTSSDEVSTVISVYLVIVPAVMST